MNNIQIIFRPINELEIVEWRNKYEDTQALYEDYVSEMSAKKMSREAIDFMWVNNFGIVPPSEPDRIYSCILNIPSMIINFTVLKRDIIESGSNRRFEVVRANSITISAYDYKKVMTKDSNGKIVMKRVYEDLTDKTVGTQINYEDSNWFTILRLDAILSRLKIDIFGEDMDSNVLFQGMDLIQASNFEFTDKEFEEKLYDEINKKFLSVESLLK